MNPPSPPADAQRPRPHEAVPDMLTHTPWWLPSAAYGPVAAGALVLALAWGSPAWAVLLAFAAGGLGWTLLEYAVHRLAFHGAPSRLPVLGLLRDGHAVHHAHPDDPTKILLHPVLVLPAVLLALTALAGAGLAVGAPGLALSAFAGLLAIWLAYGVLHWRMHCGASPRTRWGRDLRAHHLRHHHDPRCEEAAFGVSTRLWDRLAGSMPPDAPTTAFEVWPRSRREVVRAVRLAARAGLRVRAVGARRSLSGAAEGTVTLRTDLLDGLRPLPPHLAHRDDLVQVRAGTPVHVLTDALAARGRALENHAAWTGQSIAGAVGTASHGTGLGMPPMCDLVESLVLVTDDGRVVRIEGEAVRGEPDLEVIRDDDLLHAVVAGFGSFGVITDLVLRTREACWLEERRDRRTWAEVQDEIAAGALETWPWYQVLVNPYPTDGAHTCVVTRRRPVPAGRRADRRQRWIPVLFSRTPLDRVLTAAMSRWPHRIPALLDRALRATTRRPIRGPIHRILDNRPLNTAAEAHAFEHGVPAEDGVAAVQRVLDEAARQAGRDRWLTAPLSLRYTHASAHLLAPQHGRDTAMVEVIALRHARWGRRVLRPFARAVGGRPHWGLDVLTLTRPEDVDALWPTADRWRAARERLDPGPVFDSPFTDRLGLSAPGPEPTLDLGPTAPVIPPSGPWGWARHVLADPRDVLVLRSVLLGALVLPLAAAVVLAPVHPLWLALPYWAVLAGGLGRISLTLHVVSHRRLTRGPLRLLEGPLLAAIGLLHGHVPGGWQAHHVGMHHVAGNGPEDLSTTRWADRTSRLDFVRYLLGFQVGLLPRVLGWHLHRGQRRVALALLRATLLAGGLTIALLWVDPWATVVTLVVPAVVVRTALAAGNWAQHAFLHPHRTGEDPWDSSVSLIQARSNRHRFNDGLHATHHQHPGAHYSELPLCFLAEAPERLRRGAVVFRGIGDFPALWLRLMRGDLSALERQRVGDRRETVTLSDRLVPQPTPEEAAWPASS